MQRQPFGQHSDDVGLLDDVAEREEIGHRDRDATSEAEPRKLLVHVAPDIAAGRHISTCRAGSTA